MAKKWNLVKIKFREIDLFDFTSFFGLEFFKFSGLLCIVESTVKPLISRHLCNPSLALATFLEDDFWIFCKKNLVKSKKINFTKKYIFCYFKNGQKSIFELGKSLKLPKMQFHEKKIYLIFMKNMTISVPINMITMITNGGP